MTSQNLLFVLNKYPPSVAQAISHRADYLGVSAHKYCAIAYYCRELWPTLKYRAQWENHREQMRLSAQRLRRWIHRIHDGAPNSRWWVEVAMYEWWSNSLPSD